MTRKMIIEKAEDAVLQHNKKMAWLSDEENRENRSNIFKYPFSNKKKRGLK